MTTVSTLFIKNNPKNKFIEEAKRIIKEANKKTSPESIRMEKFLKSARYRNLFEPWCEGTGQGTSTYNHVYCLLDFSIYKPSTKSPFKYIHEIQAIVAEVAGYLARGETAENFSIQTTGTGMDTGSCGGRRGCDFYVPMTNWDYSKDYNRLDVW